MVVFTLRQITAIFDGPIYQVTNQVTSAQLASPAAYVFATATQAFDHYASAVDMEQYPDSYEKAVLLGTKFYRLPTVVRRWSNVALMNDDLATSLRRLQSLADELTAQQGDLIVDRTIVIQGG